MATQQSDIEERPDIEKLVKTFYEKVMQDALLGPVFAHVDWDKHLPIMYQFWSSMILGEQSYRGNPFQRHIGLAITADHFRRWLELFTETVDENFSGEHAEEIKMRARNIADVFQYRLGLMNPPAGKINI